MSGLTPPALSRFRDLLGARGSSMDQLAVDCMCGRAHLSQVVNGHRPSPETMGRIYAMTSGAEWAELVSLEHFATWNKQARAVRYGFQQQVTCAWCKTPQGFQPCDEISARAVTHGMCPPCYGVYFGGADAAEVARFTEEARAMRGRPRAFLVRTEAGLDVHRSADGTPPALADDREISPDSFAQQSPAMAGTTTEG